MALHPHTHFNMRNLVLSAREPAVELGHAISAEVKEYGADRGYLMGLLDAQRREFRDGGNVAAADAVIEVMERLDGWCAPHARI